jgi:hypothetical protein
MGDLDVDDSDSVRILDPRIDESPRLGGRLLEYLDALFPRFARYAGG